MKTKLIPIITCIAGFLSLSGCAVYNPVADFTKQRYTNAISYFNTFYNAQRLFDEAEEEVFKARREFNERPGANKTFAVPQSARQKFQTSIEKNSKVLTFYADSKWVDDALLMIGKAYFYMGDDLRSERKFLELMAQFPLSDLFLESKLWLGKSYLRQKKTEEGIQYLEETYVKGLDTDEECAGLAAFELGEYYFSIADFSQAEKKYSAALELVGDNELKAKIHFQRGKCFGEMKNHDRAEEAFASASEISPSYTFSFQSHLQQIKSKAEQKKFDVALEELDEMLTDTKNSEFFGIIHFETANIMMLKGSTSEALEKYRFVDTAFARSEESARSYFLLGKHYEETEVNYDSARTMYNKAKTEFSASDITPMASVKADIFNKYADLRKDLLRFDSLLTDEHRKKIEADTSISTAVDTVAKKDTLRDEPKSKKLTKSGKSEGKKDTVAVIDPSKNKEKNFQENPHTRMIDSLQRSIVRTKFELGGLFYLEILQPDSALYWFYDISRNHSGSVFAPRALYTIAEIRRADSLKSKSDLDSIYHEIIAKYPGSPYANEARRILGIAVMEAQKDSAQDLFERAEVMAEMKQYLPAISRYVLLAEQFPASPLAAKSLYTAGWHYENSLLMNDSAVSLYRKLLQKYPVSQFSNLARPKVAEYENEVKRVESEKQKTIEEAKLKEQQEKEAKALKEKKSTGTPSDSLSTPPNKL